MRTRAGIGSARGVVSGCIAAWLIVGGAVYAQRIIPVSPLANSAFSIPQDISADGAVVTGYSTMTNGSSVSWYNVGFLLDLRVGVLSSLGKHPNYVQATPVAVAANGTAVVGYLGYSSAAFRWTASQAIQALPLASAQGISIHAANSDVSIMVGSTGSRAFRWSEQGGFEELGLLPNVSRFSYDHASARDVSGDGSVVVGWCGSSDGLPTEGVRWSQASGIQAIGRLNDKDQVRAEVISRNGLVIAGLSGGVPFRWTPQNGMQALDVPLAGANIGYESVTAINGDGSAIAATRYVNAEREAVLFLRDGGKQSLLSWLKALGVETDGWSFHYIHAISDDGKTLAGEGLYNGTRTGFVAQSVPNPWPDPPPQKNAMIKVEQPYGIGLPNNAGALHFGNFLVGLLSQERIYTIRNAGLGTLKSIRIRKDGPGAADFILGKLATNSLGPGDSATLSVRFAPKAGGDRSAVLSITSGDTNNSPFLLNLAGFGIGKDRDTDVDGLNDAAEYLMKDLGFDWKTPQPALVAVLRSNAAVAGYFTGAQLEASRQKGRQEVIRNPELYRLLSRTNIPVVRFSSKIGRAFTVSLPGAWTRYAQTGAPPGWTFSTTNGILVGAIPLVEQSVRIIPYNGSQAGPQMTIQFRPTP